MKPTSRIKIQIWLVFVYSVVTGNQSDGSSSEFECGVALTGYAKGERRVQSPWTALIFRRTAHTDGVFEDWISGVIIGPHTVLTRGRQFWEARSQGQPRLNGLHVGNLLVGVGIFNRKHFQQDEFTQILEIDSIRPHPQSFREHSEYDFAIVQLKSAIQFSTKVRPVCLESPSNASFVEPYDLEAAYWAAPKRISGYRINENYEVRTNPIKVKAADLCNDACQAAAPASTAAQLLRGAPSCHTKWGFADHFLVGASIVSYKENRWYLSGIVTKTYGCGAQHFISPVAVKKNLNWIASAARNGNRKYTCLYGTGIPIRALCDGQIDCPHDGGSDEEASYCEAIKCGAQAPDSGLCGAQGGKPGELLVRNGPGSILRLRSTEPPPKRNPPSVPKPQSNPVPMTTTPKPTTIQFTEATARPRPSQTVTIATTNSESALIGGCQPLQMSKREKEGIQFVCTTRANVTIRGAECSESPQAPGTKLLQSCLTHYKSGSRTSFTELVCSSDGSWVRTLGSFLTCVVECGRPKVNVVGHIVNGTDTVPENWPWNAALFKLVNGVYLYNCGATLITSRLLLTAAHCVRTSDGREINKELYRIVLAPTSSKFNANQQSSHSQILEVARIHTHELYNSVNFEADIAVLTVTTTVHISSNVYPACFPFPGRENEQISRFQTSAGSVGAVVGFGVDETFQVAEHLKQIELPVVTVRDCFKVLDIFPSTTQICAGHTTGVSVCNGDSGAGLVFQEEGARKLFFVQGIVSHGQSGKTRLFCDSNRYTIFTRVSAFKEWVEHIAAME